MFETAFFLPLELVDIIAAHTVSKVTLRNLACCSHNFYYLATPYLYKHVELKAHQILSDDVYIHLRSLACLLLRRLDLASHVRQFTMSKDFSVGYRSRRLEEEGETPQAVDVDDVFKSAIKKSSHSIEEERLWLKHASWTDMDDSILALLLPNLVNLTKLELTTKDCVYVRRMIDRAIQRKHSFDTRPAFTSLTSFMHTMHTRELDLYYIAWCLELPTIRKICSRGTESENPFTGPSQLLASMNSASSPLTHLELQDCRLRMVDVTQLLRICRALKTFIYEPGSACAWWFDVSFTAIREALTAQEHSLEILWLDISPFHDRGFFNPYEDTTPMASFKSFQKLKALRLQTVFIFGLQVDENEQDDEDPDTDRNGWSLDGDENNSGQEDIEEIDPEDINWNSTSCRRFNFLFPSTLESLHFTHCHDHLPRLLIALKELLRCKSEQVPALNRLILEGDLYGEKGSWRDLVDLVVQGKERGVLVMFIQTGDSFRSIISYKVLAGNLEWRMDREWDGLFKGLDGLNWSTASRVVGLDTLDEWMSDNRI